MFLRLTESRKDRDTGEKCYKPVMINTDVITHIQPPSVKGMNTYIGLGGDRFCFVKESFEEIEKMMNGHQVQVLK